MALDTDNSMLDALEFKLFQLQRSPDSQASVIMSVYEALGFGTQEEQERVLEAGGTGKKIAELWLPENRIDFDPEENGDPYLEFTLFFASMLPAELREKVLGEQGITPIYQAWSYTRRELIRATKDKFPRQLSKVSDRWAAKSATLDHAACNMHSRGRLLVFQDGLVAYFNDYEKGEKYGARMDLREGNAGWDEKTYEVRAIFDGKDLPEYGIEAGVIERVPFEQAWLICINAAIKDRTEFETAIAPYR